MEDSDRISNDKIKVEEFNRFVTEYFHERTSTYKHLRLGQAFLNKFYPNDIFPILFYSESSTDSIDLIMETYVDYSS